MSHYSMRGPRPTDVCGPAPPYHSGMSYYASCGTEQERSSSAVTGGPMGLTPNHSDENLSSMVNNDMLISKVPLDGLKYKTRICRNYEEKGMCPYEARCMFAHGQHELRTLQQNQQEGILTEEDVKRYRRAQLGGLGQLGPRYYSHTPYAYHSQGAGDPYYGYGSNGYHHDHHAAPHQQYYNRQYHSAPTAQQHGVCTCPSCVPCSCPDCTTAAAVASAQGAPYHAPSSVLHHGNVAPGAVFEP